MNKEIKPILLTGENEIFCSVDKIFHLRLGNSATICGTCAACLYCFQPIPLRSIKSDFYTRGFMGTHSKCFLLLSNFLWPLNIWESSFGLSLYKFPIFQFYFLVPRKNELILGYKVGLTRRRGSERATASRFWGSRSRILGKIIQEQRESWKSKLFRKLISIQNLRGMISLDRK